MELFSIKIRCTFQLVSTNDVKSIIDEMRTKQVESSMDIQSVAEATTTIAKNNIKIAANTEEIKQSAKHVFG